MPFKDYFMLRREHLCVPAVCHDHCIPIMESESQMDQGLNANSILGSLVIA